MKFLSKISVTLLTVALAISTVFAQTSQESRLNVGKDAKKTITTGSSIFGNMPTKLNFDSKAEFTQFYRNLLLNNNSATKKVAEVSDTKTTTKTTDAVAHVDKIKFGNIYPNPAVNFADVTYDIVDNYKEARATVMNMVGSSLLEYPINNSNNKLRINTSELESGIYMVQFVVDGKKVSTKKLLVERN